MNGILKKTTIFTLFVVNLFLLVACGKIYKVTLPKEITQETDKFDLNRVPAGSNIKFKINIRKQDSVARLNKITYSESGVANPTESILTDEVKATHTFSLKNIRHNTTIELKAIQNYKVTLPDFFNVGKASVDLQKVPSGKDLQLYADLKEGEVLTKLTVNGVDALAEFDQDKKTFNLTVEADTLVEATKINAKTTQFKLNYDKEIFKVYPEKDYYQFNDKVDVEIKPEAIAKAPKEYHSIAQNKTLLYSTKKTITIREAITDLTHFHANNVVERSNYTTEKTISFNTKKTPELSQFQGKTVLKRTLIDSTQIESGAGSNSFVFKNLGYNFALYRYEFTDNTTAEVRFIYKIIPSITKVTLKTVQDKAHSDKFEYSEDPNTLEPNHKTKSKSTYKIKHKTVGTDNTYLPEFDITVKTQVWENNQFQTKLKNLSLRELKSMSPELYGYRLSLRDVTDESNKVKLNEDNYRLNGFGMRFSRNLVGRKVELQYENINDPKEVLKETVNVQSGVNAYEDLELRKYFRMARQYDKVYLQRNITPVAQADQLEYIDNKFKGRAEYPDLKDLDKIESLIPHDDKIEFDEKGDVTDETKYLGGSFYRRLYNPKLKNVGYKPIQFDGNCYTIDGKNIRHAIKQNSTEEGINLTIIRAGIFSVRSFIDIPGIDKTPSVNYDSYIKNVYIKGNSKSHTIGGGNKKKTPLSSGSILGVSAFRSKLDVENSVVLNTSAGFNFIAATHFVSNTRIDNAFINAILFANEGGYHDFNEVIKEDTMASPSALWIEKSEIKRCGAGGIYTQDRDRRKRQDENIKTQSAEFSQLVEAVSAPELTKEHLTALSGKAARLFSVDPTVVVKETIVEAEVNLSNEIAQALDLNRFIGQTVSTIEQIKQISGFEIVKNNNDKAKTKSFWAPMFFTNYNPFVQPVNDPENPNYFLSHNRPAWDVTFNLAEREYSTVDDFYSSPKVSELFSNMKFTFLTLNFPELTKINQNFSTVKNIDKFLKEKPNRGMVDFISEFYQALQQGGDPFLSQSEKFGYTNVFKIAPVVENILPNAGRFAGCIYIGYRFQS